MYVSPLQHHLRHPHNFFAADISKVAQSKGTKLNRKFVTKVRNPLNLHLQWHSDRAAFRVWTRYNGTGKEILNWLLENYFYKYTPIYGLSPTLAPFLSHTPRLMHSEWYKHRLQNLPSTTNLSSVQWWSLHKKCDEHQIAVPWDEADHNSD